MKFIRFIPIVALALCVSVLGACGSSTGAAVATPTQLTFWYTQGTGTSATVLAIVAQFNQTHPTIHVNAQPVDYASAHDQFANAAKAGVGAPDVFRSDVAWLPEFIRDGYFLDLTNKIDGGTSDFLPASLAYGVANNKLYSVPDEADFLALYYNKALVAAPPATMDDLRTFAKAATNPANQTYGFATQAQSYDITPFIFADGGGLVGSDGKTILVNSAQSAAGFQRLLDMIKDGSVLPIDPTNAFANAENGFKTGKVAMLISNASAETQNLMNGTAFQGPNIANFGIAAIPTGTAGDVPRALMGGQSYGIYAGTRFAGAALTFLNFLDSTANQVAVAAANSTLPTRQSAYNDPTLATNQIVSAYKPLLGTATPRPLTPQLSALFNAFDSNIQGALTGADTAQTALDNVAAAWAPLLST